MFQMKNIHLRLTAHCNKRCEHCFAALDEKMPELSCEYWLNLIAAAERLNVSVVTLTGGEPLIYHEIGKLLDKLQRCTVSLKIETNGILLEKYARLLVKIPMLKQIALSPGLCYEDEYMETLLHRLLKLRTDGLPMVLQASIILGDVEKQIAWLERFAENGIPVRLMIGHNGLGKSENLPNIPFDIMLSIGRRYVSHPMIQCELPGTLLGKAKSQGCGWNRNRADILPDGRLTPCAAIAWNYPDFVLDFVNGDNLEQIWNTNPYLNKIRNLKRSDFGGRCANCDQFESCQSSCVATNLGILKNLMAGYPLCAYAEKKEKFETM